MREQVIIKAYEIRSLKPWSTLWDIDLLTFKTSTGEDAFISVMGKNGTFRGINIYLGEGGHQTFNGLLSASKAQEVDAFLRQDCLQICFVESRDLSPSELKENTAVKKKHGIKAAGKYSRVQLVRFTPYVVPGEVKGDDLTLALEALEVIEAAMKEPSLTTYFPISDHDFKCPYFVKKKGQFILEGTLDIDPFDVPEDIEPEFNNDILLHKLKKIKKAGSIKAKLAILPEPFLDDEGTPRYPFTFTMMNEKNGLLLPPVLIEDYLHRGEQGLYDAVNLLIDRKLYPKTINCSDEKTLSFLWDLSIKADIDLEEDFFIEMDDIFDDLIDDDPEEFSYLDDLDRHISAIFEELQGNFSMLEDELIMDLVTAIEMTGKTEGIFNKDYKGLVKEAKKRKLV